MIERPYTGFADQARMAACVHTAPDEYLHVIDLPYRFCSWAFDAPENIRLWEDNTGRVVGWAVLQTPFWTMDFACDPVYGQALYTRIFDWAVQRAQAIRNTPFVRPLWFVNVFTQQASFMDALKQAGLADVSDAERWGEDAWAKVLLHRPASLALPPPAALPPGYSLRPLNGVSEVDAYLAVHRAAFGSVNMTREWRERTLQHADYAPDLDLVIAAPEGRLAAFCIGWWREQGRTGVPAGQIEPLGVHPDYQHLGLGRAILAEVIQRMLARGAHEVYVEADAGSAGQRLYEQAGFTTQFDVRVWRKEIE